MSPPDPLNPEARVRVALVTNIPAPYRVLVYELLAVHPGIDLKLFFCSAREADREWDVAPLRVPHVTLTERVIRWRGRFIHVNPDIGAQLRAFAPEVVITTGFNPTHLLAFWHARRCGAQHIAMTDGTAQSEATLSALHRWVRRVVYRRTAAFVGASEGSMALYRLYGVAPAAMFKSHLCADNTAFAEFAARAELGARAGLPPTPPPPRDVDLIFCGRFVAGKLPLFAIDVAAATAQLLGRRVRLLMLGSGELLDPMRRRARQANRLVEVEFAGFVRQADLPGHYARARVMLFPTLGDTWGVVANEAGAAGVPVLVSAQAGVAGDLIRDGENGRVLPLHVPRWAKAAARLLSDAALWRQMSRRSLEQVRPYSYANAAQGLADAVRFAMLRVRPAPVAAITPATPATPTAARAAVGE